MNMKSSWLDLEERFRRDVGTIKVKISKLQQEGQKELAEALEHVVDAVNRFTDIEDENKKALLDQLKELAHQANLEPPKRAKPGVIKSLLSSVALTLSSAGGLAEVWSTWGTKILHYFQ
jgi:hypothetical protein